MELLVGKQTTMKLQSPKNTIVSMCDQKRTLSLIQQQDSSCLCLVDQRQLDPNDHTTATGKARIKSPRTEVLKVSKV
ncbi:hypothetical protein BLOT_013928 [Blomia tropicalis]|nr:hypothetical protein BLOT_013928 [Blomia tropicalis]